LLNQQREAIIVFDNLLNLNNNKSILVTFKDDIAAKLEQAKSAGETSTQVSTGTTVAGSAAIGATNGA
jgi:hypothetical protein